MPVAAPVFLPLPGTRPAQAPSATGDQDFPPRPAGDALVDRFGRVAADLRLSVTDRCNLRCTYCMPAEGVDWLARDDLLTAAELVRLAGVAVTALGVRHVRLTGGEPLLRRDLVDIVAGIAALQPRPRIAMTTNGLGLARSAADLAAAGLDRVNVSLDTLRPDTFRALARRDRLDQTLAGLAAAASAGLAPVKVNTVLMRGVNDEQAPELLRFCLAAGYELRFIEQMPLDAGHGWTRATMVTAAEIHDRLSREFRLVADEEPRGSAPAERFAVRSVDGRLQGRVGIVASVTASFCGACDRTRLTADGQLRSCLFSHTETDLRAMLRSGADDAEIAEAWRATMWAKPAGHGIDDEVGAGGGIASSGFVQPARPMSAIGG